MDNEELLIAEAEGECFKKIAVTVKPSDDRLYCNSTWDGWGCWNYTLAGARGYINCPSYKTGFDVTRYAYKDCNIDGTWWRNPWNNPWTNYTSCVNVGDLETDKKVIFIYIGGYATSILVLILALIIFYSFRQLQCDRVTIHKNLFISYILNGLVWIFYYTLAALDGETLSRSPIWCQILHVVTQFFVASNFFWMFCEGFYLHTVIVMAFTTGKYLLIVCYITGWGLPVITSAIYTILRATYTGETKKCWMEESALQWIVLGPIIITIALNFIFLCNIVRVLITKMRAVNCPETNRAKKAVRATLILIPLLGLQYVLLPFRPNKDSLEKNIYLYISGFVTSFQGFCVALIFCFCNGEVVSLLRRKWNAHRLMNKKCRNESEAVNMINLSPKRQSGKEKIEVNTIPDTPPYEKV